MDLTSLIDLTRRFASDPVFEGNSLGWEDSEIVEALNWAQTRYAEITHCTYKEASATGATGADGIFTIPAGFILVDRVMIPEQITTGPDATITAPPTAPNGTAISASVPTQAGASYFWSVAGATITSGQGTASLTFTGLAVVGAVVSASCIVTLGGLRATGSVDVALT